jgi:DNA-directed RNA polymerase subunit RPC12/RpoP
MKQPVRCPDCDSDVVVKFSAREAIPVRDALQVTVSVPYYRCINCENVWRRPKAGEVIDKAVAEAYEQGNLELSPERERVEQFAFHLYDGIGKQDNLPILIETAEELVELLKKLQ